MFCLRNWIALLVFLTNVSPIHVVLFLLGTYLLQRPCVYCSILLFVLVFSLFDFHADWFEPRWQPSTTRLTETASALFGGDATVSELLAETAGFAISAINGTGGSLASAALDGLRRRGTSESCATPANISGFEWLRGVLEKYQFKIPCVDVTVRI